MSFVTAAAIGVGTAAGGYLAGEASKEAAKAGADASGRASAQVQAAADEARREAKQYIPAAQEDLLAGYSAAADIFGTALPEQQRLLSGGNLGAQQTTAGGYDQYRSALLGMPVDQANWMPKQVAPSAPLQNPFQTTQFTDIRDVPRQANVAALEGITTNRDLLNRVATGELVLPGVDAGWWGRLADAPRAEGDTFLSSNSILDAVRSNNPQARIERQTAGTGLGKEGQVQYRRLLDELLRSGAI